MLIDSLVTLTRLPLDPKAAAQTSTLMLTLILEYSQHELYEGKGAYTANDPLVRPGALPEKNLRLTLM